MSNIINIRAKSIASPVEKMDITNENELEFNQEYDVMPVFNNGRYCGILEKKDYDFKGNIDKKLSVDGETIFGTNNTIDDILEVLEEFGYVLLHGKEHKYYIITESDLSKQPFKVYLFSLLSNYESIITKTIRENFDKEEVLECFDNSRKNGIKNRFTKRINKNIYIDLYEMLYLWEKHKVLKNKINDYFSSFYNASDEKIKGLPNEVNDLRRDIAHPRKNFMENWEFSKLLNIIKFLRNVIEEDIS